MKKTMAILVVTIGLISIAFAAPQGVGEKMKEGVKRVAKGTKDVAGATATKTKSVARTTKRKTVKGAKTTKRVTKTGMRKVGGGTEKAGKAIKKAGQ